MYDLRVKVHFDAAHKITDYDGKCARLHGHRWTVGVSLAFSELDKMNISHDFGTIKATLKGLLEGYLDHYYLNETLEETNITAEFIAKWIYDKLLPTYASCLVDVSVWESPDCYVTYYEESDDQDA